jgi:hypothetical protein
MTRIDLCELQLLSRMRSSLKDVKKLAPLALEKMQILPGKTPAPKSWGPVQYLLAELCVGDQTDARNANRRHSELAPTARLTHALRP